MALKNPEEAYALLNRAYRMLVGGCGGIDSISMKPGKLAKSSLLGYLQDRLPDFKSDERQFCSVVLREMRLCVEQSHGNEGWIHYIYPIDGGGTAIPGDLLFKSRKWKEHFGEWQPLQDPLSTNPSEEILMRDQLLKAFKYLQGETVGVVKIGRHLVGNLGGKSLHSMLQQKFGLSELEAELYLGALTQLGLLKADNGVSYIVSFTPRLTQEQFEARRPLFQWPNRLEIPRQPRPPKLRAEEPLTSVSPEELIGRYRALIELLKQAEAQRDKARAEAASLREQLQKELTRDTFPAATQQIADLRAQVETAEKRARNLQGQLDGERMTSGAAQDRADRADREIERLGRENRTLQAIIDGFTADLCRMREDYERQTEGL